MPDRKAITEDGLQALVASEISAALGGDSSELSAQRSLASDYYHARPFGNEVEGRSAVVSTDVRDTVEWIMPTLMRMFTSGDETVEFEPETQGDEAFAKQATEYCNFIWNRDNSGFVNTYTLFKDALLQKNGVGKVWWDGAKIPKRERYYDLPDEAYTALVNDDDVEVSEHTESEQEIVVPPTAPDQPPQTQKITVHDVVVTRLKPGGRVCVAPVVPEYFLISNDGRSIKDARFVGDKTRTTLSQLRAEGISDEKLDEIAGNDSDSTTQEEISRNTVEISVNGSEPAINPSMQTIWKIEGYIKADVDGDGIAEMRKVTVAGPGYTLIKNEAWDEDRPYFSVTPIIMPHRFWGLSVAELVTDIQMIRSTLWRQYLDNAYVNNNQRMEVVAKNIIDPDELLSSRPGGYVRVKESGSITPIVTPQIGEAMLAGLQYVDQVRENRTGVSERTQGLGSNPLHETASGEQMLMTAAMGKIELIARVFAETGMKDGFKLILSLICRYQNKPRVIRLTDKWTPMDPRSWNADMDVTISVGMSTGDNQQKMQHAMMLGQAQQAAAMSGTLKVTPENAMATAELLVSSMGLKSADRFFTKPQPGEPPPKNPEMAKVEAQAQADQAKLQQEGQLKTQSLQAEGAIKTQQMQQDSALEQQKMEREFALKQWQIEQEMALKREQLAAELQLKREELQAELALKNKQIEMGHQAAIHAADAKVASSVRPGGEPG